MSMFRVSVICDGEVQSDEVLEFPSVWRAFSDTVHGCDTYEKEYRPRDVVSADSKHSVTFKDGTQIVVEPTDA